MSSEFLGQGWQFPVSTRAHDGIDLARYEDSIRQAIWIILGTARGERVMRPEFGCGIHDLVFAPNNPGTAGRAASEVRRCLVRWEPRIEIRDVVARPDPDQPTCLAIEIDYRVRATNSRFNLVYPFYLE